MFIEIHYCNFQEFETEEPRQCRTRSVREKTIQIRTEEEVPPEVPTKLDLSQQIHYMTVGDINITTGDLNIPDVPNVLEVPNVQEPMDIADHLPTQKLDTLSQTNKRTADYELPVGTELVFYTFTCNFSLRFPPEKNALYDIHSYIILITIIYIIFSEYDHLNTSQCNTY